MFEKILVCLDGSKAAEGVLRHVVDDALKLHGKLILFRVISPPETTIPVNVPGSPGVPMHTGAAVRRTINEENEATEYLRTIAGPLQSQGLEAECVVMPGAAGQTIISYARENGCTLIAVGAHGHGGLRRLAIGSTADFVVQHSSLPVLMVRE